jgi:predicted site-specific integrase-resolvase
MHGLDDLLTTEQASEVLNVRSVTLANWRWNGRGPAYIRVGKVVRYSRKAISEYINAHTHIPVVEAMRAGSEPETRDDRLARLRSQRAFMDQIGRELDLARPQRAKRPHRQPTDS